MYTVSLATLTSFSIALLQLSFFVLPRVHNVTIILWTLGLTYQQQSITLKIWESSHTKGVKKIDQKLQRI